MDEPEESTVATPKSRRATALLAALALFLALPTTAIANSAAPLTLADWMRTIFVTADRDVDASQKGVAVAPPAPPPPVVQTTSEPSPAKEPVVDNGVPRLWFRRDSDRKRSRPPAP